MLCSTCSANQWPFLWSILTLVFVFSIVASLLGVPKIQHAKHQLAWLKHFLAYYNDPWKNLHEIWTQSSKCSDDVKVIFDLTFKSDILRTR